MVLPCSLSMCFFYPFSILSTLLGEEGAGLCAYRDLFVSINLCHVFSSSWCQRLGGPSACIFTWTFQFTVFVQNVNFSLFRLFYDDQLNLEYQNRFEPLTKEKKTGSSSFGTSKSNFIDGLIRSKKLELLAFLDFFQPHIVAVQKTKIDISIATSKLFPETCQYNVYRKDRNLHGGV